VEGIQHSGGRDGEAGGVPPGSTLDRGTHAEKRMDDRSERGGTLNSGGPASTPRERIDDFQGNEGIVQGGRESDPPIVVGDGRADHTPAPRLRRTGMAKGWAGRQRSQSTHLGTRILPVNGVTLPGCNGSRVIRFCRTTRLVRVFLRSPVR